VTLPFDTSWIRRCGRCRTEDRRHLWSTPEEAQENPARGLLMRLQRRGDWRCKACGGRAYEVMPISGDVAGI